MNAPIKPPPFVTTVSTKGQIVLPQPMRAKLGWRAGDRLLVEDTDEGVLLRLAPRRAPSRLEDVRGMLKPYYKGPPITEDEDDLMNAAILREARRRWELFERTGSDYEDDDPEEEASIDGDQTPSSK